MDWTSIITALIAAITGGGLSCILFYPEKKNSAKIDNAERVIAEWQKVVEKYEHRITELESQVKDLEEKNRSLERQILDLESKAVTRGKNGRFQKAQKD